MENWEKKLLQKIRQALGRPDDRTNFQDLEDMIGIPDAANSNVDDILRTGYDSSGQSANIDGSIVERLESLQAALNIVAAGAGGGLEVDGAPGLVTALGTTGAVVTDSATSVLGAIGANNADNAFASGSVAANVDGSALERLEALQAALSVVAAGAGGGLEVDGSPGLVTALGTTGAVVTDSATSVLGAIGADNANNAFSSSSVVANEDGSVLERLEDIKLMADRAELQLADFDDFDVADADANTERWDTGYLNGAEGGSANINTTTAGQLRVSLDPDATPTASGYGVWLAQPIVNKYFSTIIDLDVSSFGTPNASWATLGMRVSPTTYDANNVVYAQRQESSGGVLNRIAVGAIFNGISQTEQYFTTSDTALAFKIERWDNVWRCYYSLTQYPDFVWVLLAQYEDPSEFMDAQQSVYLDAYSPGNADAQTAVGDFDNFKLYESIKGVSQQISGDYDSSVVAANEDGSALERLEQIQEAVNRGSGTSIAANRSLVDALGSDGTTVTDSAVSVLGAIGANNADNAFSSATVVENGDGSVLERLEELRGRTDTTGSPFTLTAAMTTVEQTIVNYTPTKNGRIAALFDLQTLVDDAYVGTVTVRLKYMIDGINLRTIDRFDYLSGTDDVMPTVSGFVTEGASFVRLTIQANVAVDDAPAKTIPFRIVESS